MPAGGSIRLHAIVRTVDEDANSVSGVTPGRYVVLTVADEGSGMTPEVCERAFDPYFTTKQKSGHKGLGLSAALGHVRRCGGCMVCRSSLGAGAIFDIYWPVADAI